MGERTTLLGPVYWTRTNVNRSLWSTLLVSFYRVTELLCLQLWILLTRELLYLRWHSGISLSFPPRSFFCYHHVACLARVSSSKRGTFLHNFFTVTVLVFSRCSVNAHGLHPKDYAEKSFPCNTQKCVRMDRFSRHMLSSGFEGIK